MLKRWLELCYLGYVLWIVISPVAPEPVQGQDAEHFAVGPLGANLSLPLHNFGGFHSGIGKCLKEVPTSSLFPNGKIPPGNGSNPFLSLVERCCAGYMKYKYDRNLCVPKCSAKCHNGFCLAPNVCVCFTDHVRSKNDECIPTCPIGCLNGHCHMNGTCTCNPGYVLESHGKFCVPSCSKGCGVNANCTAPEQCSCLPGYRLNSTAICEPVCVPSCGHGTCVSPNNCTCDQWFVLKDKSCQANCTRGCLNGRCTENDKCECDMGYRLIGNGTICEPICSKPCLFGNCTGPEHCSCFEGYELNERVCKPACKRGCKGGECIQPDKCVCSSGFTINTRGNECKPVCESGCPNGKCVAPNKCKCDFGYYKANGGCVKFDSPSSKTTEPPFIHTTHRMPIFHPTVNIHPGIKLHPTTIAPQTTRHFPVTTTKTHPIFNPVLFANTSQSNVAPKHNNCSKNCLNGHCDGNDHCKCNPGYALALGTWNKCTPYCPNGCPNGHCTSPDFCTCNYGFIKRNGTCNYQFS